MDLILTMGADLWWIAPIVVGGGAAGFFAVRRHGTVSGKRLGYDAARLELREARREAKEAADSARVARAEAARVSAERAVAKSDGAAVASARRAHREAQRVSRAAVARVKATRVRVSTERAALGAHGVPPLQRIRSQHDAVLARWMQYETDAARALAFPDMSDGRKPATAAFLAALERARDLRPAEGARVTAAEFAAYRRSVDDLARAFDIAERSARGEKAEPELPDALWDAARVIIARSTEAITRTSEAFSTWNDKRRHGR